MKKFCFGNKSILLGKKTYLMGIVNITPDSFSDGGKYYSVENGVAHALKLIEDGADMIDLGACSTRPYSVPVSEEEEQKRLLPVIAEIKKCTDIPLSIDTFHPGTAEKALWLGADIINDVSGVFNEKTAFLIREYNAGYIIMHGGVKCAPAQTEQQYADGIINAVNRFFRETYERLTECGIPSENICFDPGFGFMKDTEQNTELLKNLRSLTVKENALLIGLSRKRFIGELSGEDDAADRLGGTMAADILAAQNGADIIRSHEVKYHRHALKLTDSINR